MSQVAVRKMQPPELDTVAEVWWRSLDDSTQWLRPEQKHSMAESLVYFRTVIAQSCELWVAERDDAIVGVLAMKGDEVDRLYVATEEQSQGIGGALLNHAKSLSPTGLRVLTLQRNTPARRFYERLGFVADETGRSPPPESEPDIWYRWLASGT